jgi:hypothetical protein
MAESNLPTAGQSAVSTLSDWAGPYVTNMLGQAAALANQPYQVYQGQNQLFSGIGGLTLPQNYGQSFTNMGAPQMPNINVPSQASSVSQAAQGQTTGFGQPMNLGVTGGDNSIAAQYMNPYLQQSLQPQLNLLAQTAKQNEQADLGKLTQAGAFGGSRQAVLQGMNENALLGQQANLIGQGYNTAYKNAMDQFNAEQAQGNALANTIGNIGATQQGLNQAGVTADYNEFLNQRDYPMKQLQFEQSMLQGLPISTVSNAVQPQSGIAGLASTIGGLGSLLTGPTGLQSIMDSLNKLKIT